MPVRTVDHPGRRTLSSDRHRMSHLQLSTVNCQTVVVVFHPFILKCVLGCVDDNTFTLPGSQQESGSIPARVLAFVCMVVKLNTIFTIVVLYESAMPFTYLHVRTLSFLTIASGCVLNLFLKTYFRWVSAQTVRRSPFLGDSFRRWGDSSCIQVFLTRNCSDLCFYACSSFFFLLLSLLLFVSVFFLFVSFPSTLALKYL